MKSRKPLLKKKLSEAVQKNTVTPGSEVWFKNKDYKDQGVQKYDKSRFDLFDDETKRLLKIRRDKKVQRGTFKRYVSGFLPRIDPCTWRKPRGLQNKQRIGEINKGKQPTIGYRAPKSVRGLGPKGYPEIRIENLHQIEKFDSFNIKPKTHVIKIAKKVGLFKRLKMENTLLEKGYHITNPKKLN